MIEGLKPLKILPGSLRVRETHQSMSGSSVFGSMIVIFGRNAALSPNRLGRFAARSVVSVVDAWEIHAIAWRCGECGKFAPNRSRHSSFFSGFLRYYETRHSTVAFEELVK